MKKIINHLASINHYFCKFSFSHPRPPKASMRPGIFSFTIGILGLFV